MQAIMLKSCIKVCHETILEGFSVLDKSEQTLVCLLCTWHVTNVWSGSDEDISHNTGTEHELLLPALQFMFVYS